MDKNKKKYIDVRDRMRITLEPLSKRETCSSPQSYTDQYREYIEINELNNYNFLFPQYRKLSVKELIKRGIIKRANSTSSVQKHTIKMK